MARETKNLLHIGIGLIDFLRDKIEELNDKIEKRGGERAEDIKDFLDDLIENIPVLRAGADEAESHVEPDERTKGRAAELIEELDVRGRINGFLSVLGLATGDDIREMNDRLERLGRAVKSAESGPRSAKSEKK